MKEIKLTQGQFAIVDDEDFEMINAFSWQANKAGKIYYASMTRSVNGEQVNIGMHRFLLNCIKGDKKIVDHINHNGLDNRRCNLRVCGYSENAQNRIKHKSYSSKYKGVYLTQKKYFKLTTKEWRYYEPKWKAIIKIGEKQKRLGTFKSEADAALAYNKAAIKYFGSYAFLNEIYPTSF